jgi:hypothetical protein
LIEAAPEARRVIDDAQVGATGYAVETRRLVGEEVEDLDFDAGMLGECGAQRTRGAVVAFAVAGTEDQDAAHQEWV